MTQDTLSQAEVERLIDVSVAAIYERAYNAALDDVVAAVDEGLEPAELKHRLVTMRKSCFTSTSQRQ